MCFLFDVFGLGLKILNFYWMVLVIFEICESIVGVFCIMIVFFGWRIWFILIIIFVKLYLNVLNKEVRVCIFLLLMF